MKTTRKYSCAACEGKVSKTPCGKDHGLGGWTCDNCGRGIKVKVSLENK